MPWPILSTLRLGMALGFVGLLSVEFAAEGPVPKAPTLQPQVHDLGNQRYRIGRIEINQAAQCFTVPGKVLRLDPPLEFLAITKGGFKGYESLLELEANAYEFNVACLLIGFDADKGKAPHYHFDPAPVQGEAVEIWVSWEQNGETITVDAADLVRLGDVTMPRGEWVYTGSVVTPQGEYLAHRDGTIIGFVHDPASIIEHRSGFGLGKFGEIRPNQALLPPIETRLTLTIQRRKSQ
jgi:hypothetical protein